MTNLSPNASDSRNPTRCEFAKYKRGFLYRCKNKAQIIASVSGRPVQMCNIHASLMRAREARIEQYKAKADQFSATAAKLEAQQEDTLQVIGSALGAG